MCNHVMLVMSATAAIPIRGASMNKFIEPVLQEIKRLRRDLTAAGAQTFTAPWPGCVKTLVFPEQLLNMVAADSKQE